MPVDPETNQTRDRDRGDRRSVRPGITRTSSGRTSPRGLTPRARSPRPMVDRSCPGLRSADRPRRTASTRREVASRPVPRFDPDGTGLMPTASPDWTRSSTWPCPWRARRGTTRGPSRSIPDTGVVFGNIVLPTATALVTVARDPGDAFEERLGAAVAAPDPGEPLNAFPAGLPAAVVAPALGIGAWPTRSTPRAAFVALRPQAGHRRTSVAADAMLSGECREPMQPIPRWDSPQLGSAFAPGRPPRSITAATARRRRGRAGMFVLKRAGRRPEP
jgi:hypothetical protein